MLTVRFLPLVLLLLLLSPAGAQPTGLVRAGDRFRDASRRAVLVSWARGLEQPEDLPRYVRCGFNTVLVRVVAGDEAGEARARRLAVAASGQGLWVVVGLDPLPLLPRGFTVGDEAQTRVLQGWLIERVTAWQHLPGLLAYTLSDEPEERLSSPPEAFQAYLAARYGTLEELRRHWRFAVESFAAVTPEALAVMAAQSPGGIGRPQMDVAHWRQTAVREWLGAMTVAVAAADPAHPVFGGLMSRCRTLLAAPPELAGLQPVLNPSWLPRDTVQYEAVPIARQAGRFVTAAVLDAATDPNLLARRAMLAIARGAGALVFDDWTALRAVPERAAAVLQIQTMAADGQLAQFEPQPGAVVLLDGFARGPLSGGLPVYGYGDFGGDEPAGLLLLLRYGTRYGPLDVVLPRDLERTELSRYGTLFAPAAFNLDDGQVGALVRYVAGGGVLLADLGLGCYPAGELAALHPRLATMFDLRLRNVQPLGEVLLSVPQRQRLAQSLPGGIVFPELPRGVRQPGSLYFRRATSILPGLEARVSTPNAMARDLLLAPTAFVQVGLTAQVLGRQTQVDVDSPADLALAGLTANRYGDGVALFWGTFAWQSWHPGEPLFDAVHAGLMGHRPALELAAAPFVPHDIFVARGAGRLWLQRVSGLPVAAVVDLPVEQARAYPGGLNVVRRPLPLDHASVVQGPRPALLQRRIITLQPGEVRCEQPVPVTLTPAGQADSAAVEVIKYHAGKVDLAVYGKGPLAQPDAFGHWAVVNPEPSPAELAIDDGLYAVRPGSRHQGERWGAVGEILAGGIRKVTRTVQADASGTLVVAEPFGSTRLTFTPLADPPGAPAAAGP